MARALVRTFVNWTPVDSPGRSRNPGLPFPGTDNAATRPALIRCKCRASAFAQSATATVPTTHHVRIRSLVRFMSLEAAEPLTGRRHAIRTLESSVKPWHSARSEGLRRSILRISFPAADLPPHSPGAWTGEEGEASEPLWINTDETRGKSEFNRRAATVKRSVGLRE